MATVDDLGDELPPDTRTVGATSHVEDHNKIAKELGETQDVLKQLAAATPTIKGSFSSINSLPNPGTIGDMYLVGPEQILYSWFTKAPETSPAWHSTGSLLGEQGPPGASGTVLGILDYGELPPSNTPAGTLWWVADSGTVVPPPDTTVTLVGTAAGHTDNASLTLNVSSGGIVTQTGDVAVLCVAHGSNADVPTPSGWDNPGATAAAYYRTVDTSVQARIFTRTCPASMGNVTVTAGSAVKLSASLMIFRNVKLGTGGIVNAINSSSTTTDSLTHAAPVVTPTANSMVCGFWFERVGSGNTVGATIAKPAAFTAGSTSGLSQSVGSGTTSVVGGYDLTVNTTAGRPTGTQNWVKTGYTPTQLGAFTLALEQV